MATFFEDPTKTGDEIKKISPAEAERIKRASIAKQGDDAVAGLQEALDNDPKVTAAKLEEHGVFKPRAVFKSEGESGTNPGEFDNAEDAIENLFKRMN